MNTAEMNRARLLQMTRGHEDMVRLYNIGYMVLILPAAVADAYDKQHRGNGYAMRCEPNAVQRICAAAEAREAAKLPEHIRPTHEAATAAASGVKWQGICATQCYGEDADADDIAEAMAAQPCLVNYGGTLRAMNIDKNGYCAVILKDMQRT